MKKRYITYIGMFIVMLSSACKKQLEENAYDQLIADNFYNNKTEVLSAVLRPYTHANAWVTPSGQDGWWRPAELSADQLAWPTKGRHGEDGGKWKRLHYHTWTVDEGGLNNAWRLMYTGVGFCNDPIENIEKRSLTQMGLTQAEKDAFVAELKLLRAFHYLKLMDLFGNIPVVTQVGIPARPETMARKDVFNFIEKEIKENIDKAPKLSKAQLGRMSQASAYAMLTELYLNAEIWTGTARWDDCIAAADQLINGAGGAQNGNMALDLNITDQYKTTNDLSKEVIFSIAYNFSVANFQPSWTGEFYHFKQQEIYGGGRNGNNGVVVVPGNYTKFENTDLRKTTWLSIGPQVKFVDGKSPVLASEEYNGLQLTFVDNIQKNKNNSTLSNMSEGEENSGVRFNKYKLGNQFAGPGGVPAIDPQYNNTDWNVYRLTWIYFAKAEALMRKNGGTATADALALINTSKQRAYTAGTYVPYTAATLTMDELLTERGREFIFEGFRRDDMIRFGKFTTGTWWDHTASTATKALYPIPQQQRDLNVNLQQNPGY
ncbi:RagB/SusD family nutrient uptake outer membrane protein [Pedobacter sp. MC2016-15]|uniref:RagB/SusD family nutrient uptake outer membrane protein n=1 Tax=Pedobacter sp. MC2016-15 TaxID=2994473 RepID=UPI00224785D8|nr:RagB/SusD family nutrient uptake outer membrane protein [Pedobacter sp. MC2016-15]MCX2478578.1 RagB/SusD family nutrient uptake outer membrane protein [Pedobacter sp. MC2016-15]